MIYPVCTQMDSHFFDGVFSVHFQMHKKMFP